MIVYSGAVSIQTPADKDIESLVMFLTNFPKADYLSLGEDDDYEDTEVLSLTLDGNNDLYANIKTRRGDVLQEAVFLKGTIERIAMMRVAEAEELLEKMLGIPFEKVTDDTILGLAITNRRRDRLALELIMKLTGEKNRVKV